MLKLINIDDKSGEITLISRLDYEKHKKFEILAVPIEAGEGIEVVTIEVEDVNNHSPTFPKEKIEVFLLKFGQMRTIMSFQFQLNISEFARIGTAYPLPQADDRDGKNFTIKRYRIVQGNVNNVFKISTRTVHGALYADLVVNGQLDREYRDKYELIVEAIDGGKPPKVGRLYVHVFILDANDNAPIFTQPRYGISVSANLTVGSQILHLKATDGDIEENGRVRYRLRKVGNSTYFLSNCDSEVHTRSRLWAYQTQTRFEDMPPLFSLSPNGVLSSTARLLPGTVHDLIVVAYDGGVPPLETTAIVTVTVLGTSLTAPAVDIIWLTDSGTAHFLENITLGTIVARLSLNEEQKDCVVTLSGCPSLCLRQSQSSSVYLLLVCGTFDRESSSEYHLKFSLKRGTELVLDHPVILSIGDINDNTPVWPQAYAHITLNRSTSAADQTTVLVATDADQGLNGRVRYSVLDSDIIAIDPNTGRLNLLKELDCSLGAELRFRVRAADGGMPSLSTGQ
uniref:Cadherin domain protein n=1 Tax=Angiostrongylus cantonensis TaxID=6313 RepID=A0A0K0CYT5_ANGCA